MTEEPTDDALIARALEIREDIEAIKAKSAADLEPYEMGLQDIENALLARMISRQSKSIGTVHGTAYQSAQLRVKVADRNSFVEWIFKDPDRSVFITNHVAKEAVKAFIETFSYNPPGIETTNFVQCNIRKA